MTDARLRLSGTHISFLATHRGQVFLDKGVPRHHLLELQPQITTDLFLAKPGDAVGLQAFCQPGLTSSYSAPWSKTSPKSTPKYHTRSWIQRCRKWSVQSPGYCIIPSVLQCTKFESLPTTQGSSAQLPFQPSRAGDLTHASSLGAKFGKPQVIWIKTTASAAYQTVHQTRQRNQSRGTG